MPIKKNFMRNTNKEGEAAAPAVEVEEEEDVALLLPALILPVAVCSCLTKPARNRGSLISHTGNSLPHVASNPNRALIRPTSQ
jgi:hypothetical protein